MMTQHAIDTIWQGSPQCESCAIRHLVLFADLKKQDFILIHQPITELQLSAGQYLYRQGEMSNFVYTVRSGLIKLVRYHQDGRHRIIRLLKQGDLAGMEALNGQPLEQYAVIIEPASVCQISVETIGTLNKCTPRIYKTLTTRWQQALHDANVWLTEFSTGPAQKRVASLLLYLASNNNTGISFYLPGREDMGSLLAITTETTSRIIADFRRRNLIQVDPLNSNKAWANSDDLGVLCNTL